MHTLLSYTYRSFGYIFLGARTPDMNNFDKLLTTYVVRVAEVHILCRLVLLIFFPDDGEQNQS